MTQSGLAITRISRDQLDELEPLWNALREHHVEVAPAWLGPPYPPEVSWRRRRARYDQWLTEEDGFALLAHRDAKPIAYAMVRLRTGSPTWPLSELAGELETLCVLPDEQGKGIGSDLLDAVYAELRRLGVTELGLHVLSGNDSAMRFYDLKGFRPFAAWLSAPVPPA
jgi:GNAT superfamily N-acetyltransferase